MSKSYLESLVELFDHDTPSGSNTLFLYYLSDNRYYGETRPPYAYYLGFLQNGSLLPLNVISENGPKATILHSDDENLRREVLESIVAQMLAAHDRSSLRLTVIESGSGLEKFKQCDLLDRMVERGDPESNWDDFLDRAYEAMVETIDRNRRDIPVNVIVTDNVSLLLHDPDCRDLIMETISHEGDEYSVHILATDDPLMKGVDQSMVSYSNNILLRMSKEASEHLFGSDGLSRFDSGKAAILVPGHRGKVRVVNRFRSLKNEMDRIISRSESRGTE